MRLSLLALALVTLAGCDSGPETVLPITGTFTGTYAGQPATLTLPPGIGAASRTATIDANRDGTPETYTVTGNTGGTSEGGTLALLLEVDGQPRYTLGGQTRPEGSPAVVTLRASLASVADGTGGAVVLTSAP